MRHNYCGVRAWAFLAATLVSIIAVFGGPGTNSMSLSSPSTNRLDSKKGNTSGMASSVTGSPGWLGLVITGCPEGAVVERVVIGDLGWQAGMHSGDVIVAINKVPLQDLPLPRIAKLLRESAGSEIELTLKRPGQKELLKVKPKRAVPSLDIIGL
jgi:C-terminal processing protease CtpA/Prc